MMERKFASAVTLGYACLFISGWLISMINAHWFIPPVSYTGLMLILILGGVVLAISGIFSYINADTLNTSLFLVFSALLFSYALTEMSSATASQAGVYSGFSGWIYALFAVFIFYLWIGSFGEGSARNLFLLGLWLTLAALAIANWASSPGLDYVAGYLGMGTSLLAGYVSASGIIYKLQTGRAGKTEGGEAAASHNFKS
jgi:succinate-acetate transporter protein